MLPVTRSKAPGRHPPLLRRLPCAPGPHPGRVWRDPGSSSADRQAHTQMVRVPTRPGQHPPPFHATVPCTPAPERMSCQGRVGCPPHPSHTAAAAASVDTGRRACDAALALRAAAHALPDPLPTASGIVTDAHGTTTGPAPAPDRSGSSSALCTNRVPLLLGGGPAFGGVGQGARQRQGGVCPRAL
ncbi:MAG: hypothetical protein WDW38_010321 [Sanguina aurantia]